MAIQLFGFSITRSKDSKLGNLQEPTQKTFALPQNDDGAVTIQSGAYYGHYVDLDGVVRNEIELITRYREMSMQPELETAVDEIVNEAIVMEDSGKSVDINMDELQQPDNIKRKIKEEFDYILKLLNFGNMGHDIFRRWYIDGRMFWHIVIDESSPALGIQEIRYIDPRRIRKIREIQKTKDTKTGMEIIKTQNEYYLYNERGVIGAHSNLGTKISVDSIVNVNSGLMDAKRAMVLSYLHKAIKPLNQLRTLEDALVIYRLARAPERRVWYIDVGNLPKMKAEQYLRDIMVKHKNRLIYDAQTGDIRDDRKFMTMLEDYWLPRREGGRGTEVTTLPGGQTLGQMDDVLYFQKKFLQALNVPVSRLNSDSLFSVGRATEITRDELKFDKFIVRLRSRFSQLFLKLLEKQLILKGVTTQEDWKLMSDDIRFDFATDNYFNELKNAEMNQGRLALAQQYQSMAGIYVSHKWIRKNVLMQSEDDIQQEDKLINVEQKSNQPRWINPNILSNEQIEMQTDEMEMQHQQMMDGAGPQGAMGGDPELADKMKQVQNAQAFVEQMKKMPKANRTMQDEAKYKAAVQILAKNQDLVKRMPKPTQPEQPQQ